MIEISQIIPQTANFPHIFNGMEIEFFSNLLFRKKLMVETPTKKVEKLPLPHPY